MSEIDENQDAFSELREGKDFYIENGNYVFTEGYLKRRGYCCGSGCRHCPYQIEVDEAGLSIWDRFRRWFSK